MWLKRKLPELDYYDQSLSRERLIQLGRIAFIDDEEPLLISELRDAGFSVDHDTEGNEVHKIDQQLFDVAVLDYFGVGRKLGQMQGLDLLKHIKRVSPRTRVIAYTSRSLNAQESEFFRQSDAVLRKDSGLVDSLALIEQELRKSFSKEHLFEALLQKLKIEDPQTKQKARVALVKALGKQDENGFREFLSKILVGASEKGIEVVLTRLFGAK